MPSVTGCFLERSISCSVDSQLIGTYKLRYRVMTDAAAGPETVANGAVLSSPHPLPNMWQTWSYLGDTDSLSYAQEYTFTRSDESLTVNYVDVTFKPLPPGDHAEKKEGDDEGEAINSEPNPMERKTVFWWDREIYTKIVERDREEKAILNPLKRQYDVNVEEEATRGVLVAEINVATLGEVIALSKKFERAVNSTAWDIGGESIPARNAVCREVSAGPPVAEHGYTFYRVVFRFAFQDEGDTWDHPMAQRGYSCWVKNTGTGEYLYTGGNPDRRRTVDFPEPICLNEDGTYLDDEDGTPIIKKWRIKREVNFNELPFIV